MNATKLAALVLVCIVAIAMVSSVVGFAFASKAPKPLGDPINDPKPNSPIHGLLPLGDPINDPKPNNR